MVHGSWLKANGSWLITNGASLAPGPGDALGPAPDLGARHGPRGRAAPLGHEP